MSGVALRITRDNFYYSCNVGGRNAAEPGVGAEAPSHVGGDATDAEQADDDVEFPEAVVLVGKTHWRCVTCMVLHPRTTSIDEHMNTDHKQQEVPPPTLSVLKTGKRGQRRGRGAVQAKVTVQSPTEPQLGSRQLRSSLRLTQNLHRGKSGRGRGSSIHKNAKQLQGRGRSLQRGRGRGRGMRGSRKVLTKPFTSEDSDTEIENHNLSPPHNTSAQKRKTGKSVVEDEEEPAKSSDNMELPFDVQTQNKEDALPASSPPPSKKARTAEENVPALEESPFNCAKATPKPSSAVTLKDLMKEKYVVFVEKAGTSDSLSEYEAHMDNDPPLAIEIPSLQADTLLPPATPLLPEIHGPPETPVPPDTPHLSEVQHQPDSFHPAHTPEVDCQYPSHSHEVLPPPTQSIVSSVATEHLSRAEDRAETETSPAAEGPSVNRLADVNEKESTLSLACRTCGAAFDSLEELRTHREEMVKFDVLSCNSCGDKFHGLHQLNIHVFTVHEKFAPKFCFLCDADCLDGYELEEHLLEHTSVETDREDDANDSIQHACKICGAQVEGNLSDLMNHYHTIHDQLICTKCFELFTDLTEYEEHRMLHSSQTEGQGDAVVYSCPVSDCFQICADREALMDHISWHEDRDLEEEELNLLHCHHCGGPFRNTMSLQRHLAETHGEPDLKPFVCELCGADYSHSLELHQHNTIHHTGIKRYGCAYCDQRFAYRSAHRRHVASEHDVAATVLHM